MLAVGVRLIVHVYEEFKSSVDFEMYLDVRLDKFRTVSLRLRLSSRQLNIEVDRNGSKIVGRHQRLCLLCDKHDVETFHYAIVLQNTNSFISLLNWCNLQTSMLL